MASPRYFLKVEIAVKDGQMGMFIRDTVILVPKVEAAKGWKLMAALSGVSGTPNNVVHLWALPDADALLDGMIFFGSDPVEQIYSDLLSRCASQKQDLYTAMPYNPAGANAAEHNQFLRPLGKVPPDAPNTAPRAVATVAAPKATTGANIAVWVMDSNFPNGTLFSVPAEVYTNPEYVLAIGSDAASIPVSLLSGGATVANIPKDTTGLGGMCYLVNLPGLSESAISDANPPQMTARQMVIAVQEMLRTATAAVPGTTDMAIAGALGKIAVGVTAKEDTSDQNLIVYVNPDPNNLSAPNGGIYSVPYSVYTSGATVPPAEAGGADGLLLWGTVVANMPANTPPGGYLLNIPALQPPPVNLAKRPKFTASQVLVAVEALLQHTEAVANDLTEVGLLESVKAVVTQYA